MQDDVLAEAVPDERTETEERHHNISLEDVKQLQIVLVGCGPCRWDLLSPKNSCIMTEFSQSFISLLLLVVKSPAKERVRR